MTASINPALKAISGGEESSDRGVRRILAADLAECRISRAQVAFELSQQAGRHITLAQLEAYVAETKSNRFPVDLVAAWVRVTGSRRLIEALAGELGYSLATEEDREFAELGRTTLRDDKLRRRLWVKVSC